MKNFRVISIFIFLAIFSNACKKDNTATSTAEPLVGSWRVSSFVKDSVDKTNQFTTYTFTCTSGGGMTIQGNGNTYNCSWGWNDDSHSMCNFHVMGCDNNSILWECDDDWDLTIHDSNHCYFSSHNPNHHNTMTWTKN